VLTLDNLEGCLGGLSFRFSLFSRVVGGVEDKTAAAAPVNILSSKVNELTIQVEEPFQFLKTDFLRWI
jgi:hypothetical protein